MKSNEIIKQINDNGVKFISLQFTDLFGELKEIVAPVSQIQRVLGNKFMFDGSSVAGFAKIENSDMSLYPDLATFQILPDPENKTARLICDVHTTNGQPFDGCPRAILKRALKRAEKLGYIVNVGPECEFFMFNPDGTNIDDDGYCGIGTQDLGNTIRKNICKTLEQLGFEVEASGHEIAPSQHEITFKYMDALRVADGIMTFKKVVKGVALQHGVLATFMPKPRANVAGSGMHVNISLASAKTKQNLFEEKNGDLTQIAYNFIAGLMKHVKSFAPLTNPLVNSYKRLIPGYSCPVHICYSSRNRSALIRIPHARQSATRIELRSPDPSCNPYLALAVIISAGLSGIENNTQPPAPINGNIFKLTRKDKEQIELDVLPPDLELALAEMENSTFVKNVLGMHAFNNYVKGKREELNQFRTHVTDWELAKYLKY
jgi:glutamine synthetase